MSSMKRWKGLNALVQDMVLNGSDAVRRIQLETVRKPFVILEQVPPIAGLAKGIHAVHDAAVSTTHGSIRVISRLVGATVDMALEAAEGNEPKNE